MQHNIKMFSSQVEQYKKYYLTPGENYLIKKYFKGKKVLVLGCGAGRTLIPLHQMGYQVTGIDITPKMIEAAKQKIKTSLRALSKVEGRRGNLIKVFLMDACNLKFADNSFDIVFFPSNSMSCIYPDIYQCILEARRVMKTNGVFVFSTHSRFNLKALPRFFKGPYANYYGIYVYRSTPLDWIKVRRYFKQVTIIPSSSIEIPWKEADWKDLIFKMLPFFDRSTYFICRGKNG
jgi:SAM-dependent methyltransferase